MHAVASGRGGPSVKCHINAGRKSPMMPSPRHPHPAVLCGTSDGNSKRDVGFGARNLTLLSFGGINKEWKEGGGACSSLSP